MTGTLALQNLLHDRVRFAVTLAGVVVAVVLIVVQLGLFIGFANTTSSLVDNSRARIWVVSLGTRNVDQAAPLSERRRFQTYAVPGVAAAEALVTEFARWEKPHGGTETVLVVGFDPDGGLAGPWNVVAGDVSDLKTPGNVMIDRLYAEKLGVSALGDIVEIEGHRARVVGFTHGIRSFTQSPYVFTSLKSARKYARLPDDRIKYVLATLHPGADVRSVKSEIQRRFSDVEALTAEEFSGRTQFYWMFTTGAGLALLAASGLGLLVGSVVVAQTLYATTVDHLREFGTLRAMGATNRYLYRIIVKQALISAGLGYAVGLTVSLLLIAFSGEDGPAISTPPALIVLAAVLTTVMCVSSALVCISKVTRIDPAMVFK